MNGSPSEPKPPLGLRERKKAKTRTAIQHHALRLFREQGYSATTVEEIAEAAEVSPSTFFRYFPSKEDLVLTDDYDSLIVEAFHSQPKGLGAIAATRASLQEVFAGLGAQELADMRERAKLALDVPELRAATLDQFAQTMRQITDLIAEQVGGSSESFAIQTLAGAILGVMISAEFYWVEHPDSDLFGLLDDALALLEEGLPV